ncbi:hypothetical protein F66182_194 [Fusarium sp. NRRL 66182]|nr:hypothetical protein F66182_194 [Fusarium sp. NRRL 66182]
MGLVGLMISSLLGIPDSYQTPNSGICCNRRNRNQNQQANLSPQQPQTATPESDYANMSTGRPSCHQRKMERRYQRQMQRAERCQLRAEQRAERDLHRAERRQAGAMMVKSGVQKIGITGGQQNSANVQETRDVGYELGASNEQGYEKDAPPAYEEVVRN